jgi:Xaa-Pro dipeptidase
MPARTWIVTGRREGLDVMTLAFKTAEYEDRVERAQRAVAEAGLDALLVTSPENICYLSGFWTSGYHVFQGLVIPRSKAPFLVVRNIEVSNVTEHSWIKTAYPINNLDIALDTLADAMRSEGIERGRVGVEVDGARFTMTRIDQLSQLLPTVTFVAALDIVESLRAIKSDTEVEYIREAVRKAERALVAGVRVIKPTATDSDVAAAVAAELAYAGSEFTGSPPYVVEGVASERAHAVHANRPIPKDGHVWLEVSASVNRYQGVVSRIGGLKINDDIRRYFDISSAAIEAMMKAMRPGVSAGAVDEKGRATVEAHNARNFWKNRAAYSLGLAFPPGLGEGHIIDIKPNEKKQIRKGMVFHLIPILKVPCMGAIARTETVVVTEDGAARLGTLEAVPLTPDGVAAATSAA